MTWSGSRAAVTGAVLALLAAALLAPTARAAGVVNLGSLGVPYTQDFDTLANTGTSSVVPAGWEFAESGTNANLTYTAGTGSSNAGDTYSFGATGNMERAFGGLRSGTLVPLVGAQFTNNTGSTITSLEVAYTGEQWRLGQITAGRAADRLDFQLSTNATSLTTGTWADHDSLDFSSPAAAGTVGALNGNAAANRTARSFIISGLSIPDGATFWIRWTDTDLIPGADDGLSVDDFSLTPRGDVVQPNLTVGDVAANEGNSGTTTFTFTVSLSAPAGPGGVSFNIATADGSATSPGDYASSSLTGQVIPAGSSTYSFPVTVNGDLSVEPDEGFSVSATNVVGATVGDPLGAGLIRNDDFTPIPIREIQEARHFSSKNGQTQSTEGVVTALRTAGGTRGFYLQDPNPDSDIATSEGIFVFTGSSSNPAALVAVGDAVQVRGRVSEFRAATAGLTLTELVGPLTVTTISAGNPLPPPVVIGGGGRVPPATVIDDDATGSVETSGSFDPAFDGIDFYESLENMRVQVADPVATGPTSDFGSNREIPVVVDGGANASLLTPRGGILVRPTDFNPERVILNDWISGGPRLPDANVGDSFPGTAVGLMDYSFGNFKLQVASLPARVSGGITRDVADATDDSHELSVGTFNLENLAASNPPSKFASLADLIVNNLRSPDILAVEEVQDRNGTTNNGVVDAAATYATLIAAIQTAGGPTYDYRQIDPVNGQDGGAPGGNIRQAFLFRTDRGVSFVDAPGAGPTTANAVVGTGSETHLQYSPGRVDPINTAFSTSRKPLAGEFTFNGHRFFVVANHFNSKGGDDPLFGRFQPPVRSSEVQRHQQAQVLNDFVSAITTADPDAGVIVLGDLNDFVFSETLSILKGDDLNNLMDGLPENERYSYVFEGNSQVLDHILVSDALLARPIDYDVVHVNAEFADQASDHDPQVALVTLNDAPTADAGGPYSVVEGQSVTLSATGTDREDDARGLPLSYAWDLDNNGSFETAGPSVPFVAPANSAPSVFTVKVQTTDSGGRVAVDTATVQVTWPFGGFFRPVDNLPTLNSVNAGRSIPIKFSLSGDQGLNIMAAGYPRSETIPCSSTAEVDGIEETVTAGGSSLSYDPGSDTYNSVWKTSKAWAGTCRQLVVKLTDGTVHRANFDFRR